MLCSHEGSLESCIDGDVRFDTNINRTLIQVCTGREWGYVCAVGFSLTMWTTADASVFCQQLGRQVQSMSLNQIGTGIYL